MKTTSDDIRLALAYFNLHASKQYSPAEIVVHKSVRKQFLAFARRLLGTSKRAIMRRLTSMCVEL